MLSGWAGKVFARIYHSYCRHRGFIQGETLKEREIDAESVRGRVHVAAVAQLVGEERKRLEQIRPKACCPTCLYTLTHTHTLLRVRLLILSIAGNVVLSFEFGKPVGVCSLT